MPLSPSRRSVLRAAGLGLAGGVASALVASCTADPPATPPAPPTADEVARGAALAAETALADLAARTGERHPRLTAATAAAGAHTAHAAALEETLRPSPTPTGSPPARQEVPSSRPAAARALASAQRRAAEQHRSALAADAATGDLARLLASVAGSDDAFAAAVLAESS